MKLNKIKFTIGLLLPFIANVLLAQTTATIGNLNSNGASSIDINIDNTNAAASVGSITNNKTPRNIVWIEYGDGQFSMDPQRAHYFYNNPNSNCNLFYIKSTGIYAKGGKPPKQAAKKIPAKNLNNKAVKGLSVFAEDESEDVKITPSVPDIVAGDTMVYALSYRKPATAPSGNYKLIFFYNKDGQKIFKKVLPEKTYMVRDGNEKMPLPFLRTHNKESLTAPTSLPAKNYVALKSDFDKSDYLVMNVNITDNEAHTIFVTMVPLENTKQANKQITSLDLLLVDPDNNIKKAGYAAKTLGKLAPHDPNWQEAIPTCLVLPKRNQEINYQIHFQNIGAGPATKVVVKTAIPSGLLASEVIVTNWAIGGIMNNPKYSLNVDKSRADSIVFEFLINPNATDKILYGTYGLSDAPVNPKTMGDIYFKCYAKPTVPNIIKSGTSIYFDTNEAVQTNETKVEFKKCCDCENDCNIKTKSKFVQWLMCKDC
jgi:uncharacterized repeat protein (TIGR01451 family)